RQRCYRLFPYTTLFRSGMGAFGYETAEAALQEGFLPDVISSDVHVIAIEGPGYDLLHTMSKLLNCGLTLPQVIAMATSRHVGRRSEEHTSELQSREKLV